MALDTLQWWVQRAGAVALVVALAAVFWGLARGLPRQQRIASGWRSRLLRAPPFYAAASVVYFGLCYLIWQPLPWQLSASSRAFRLLLGSLLYFPGLGLLLWARLTLGRMYFVSSTVEAPLYADHRLITTGPFALVRHPMYLGLLLTGLGGILIYWTWTFVFVAGHFFGMVLRARREEEALAAALGPEWESYRRRVPAWIPHLRR
jgi:protein-S-isoprenylcysteine O-methyltransferase Ste14